MALKERLENLKQELFTSIKINRDFEFEADLEDHPLGMQNVYRLHYVDYHRFGERYGMGPNHVGVVDWPFQPFMLPSGMNREDAFKVLSYLTDRIEENPNIKPYSQKSVATLNQTLDLEKLDFTRLNICVSRNETDIIDLFTVTGRLLLFKQSEYYSKYFEWYTENVTLEEVKNIYDRCGMEFPNIVFGKDSDETAQNHGKMLNKTYSENN